MSKRVSTQRTRYPLRTHRNSFEWHKSVCVLCSANCGIEVRLDGRKFVRVRGNKAHVSSAGYTCEKALRLDHYQNCRSRLTSPLKCLDDGSYIEIDWDTAIEEVAAGLAGVAQRHGGDKILYYGGGGQGNHLCGVYSTSTRAALGITRRSNALAQEKTGEAWVEGRMFGAHTHGEFAEAQVALFLGKNPWHSHGFDEARRVLRQIANDPNRTMIVIDPRYTETAALADHWLSVQPGTDAYLLTAIAATLVQHDLCADSWLTENVNGTNQVKAALQQVDIASFAERCGIEASQINEIAKVLASAESLAVYEDLGTQMAPHSTLVSYLQRVVWVLLGHYGKVGSMSAHSSLIPLFSYRASGSEPTDPVTGGAIISGLVPCNEIADGMLSDHPERSRAMFIESANPVHSLAGSKKFRKAMRQAEFTVVIDIAFTETAAEADYVLPAASQYEKVETTFFNTSFPENRFCIRPPILEPLEGTLPEPEIHSRLAKALGVLDESDLAPLRAAARVGMSEFSNAFGAAVAATPMLGAVGAVVLYETLGSVLPKGMAGAAPLWFSAQRLALKYPKQVLAAGHRPTGVSDKDVPATATGDPVALGSAVFEAMISNPDGVVLTRHDHHDSSGDSWSLLGTPDHKINLVIDEMLTELERLTEAPTQYTSDEFPMVLSAGERRSFTANTIMRNPAWRKRDLEGTLRVNPDDAAEIGLEDGSRVRVSTPGGSAVAVAELNTTMQSGHVSLPNGGGLAYSPAGGGPEIYGVAPNELTTTTWRDPIAGTPWHKHVPARLEPIPA